MNTLPLIYTLTKSTLLILMLLTMSLSPGFGQKQKLRIQLDYHNIENSKYLKFKVITKIDKVYQPVPGVIVDLYKKDQSAENKLASIKTDALGLGEYRIESNFFNSIDSITVYIASITNDSNFKDKSKEIEIYGAIFEVNYKVMDSVKTMMISLNDSNRNRVGDVEVKIYVKRLFGLLPIGGDYLKTDVNGNLNVTVPDDIHGDKEGNIVLISRIEDNDEYGNLEKSVVINWGVLKSFEEDSRVRALWGNRANAPISLVVVANSIILGIWIVIVYIIYQLYVLKKLGKQKS